MTTSELVNLVLTTAAIVAWVGVLVAYYRDHPALLRVLRNGTGLRVLLLIVWSGLAGMGARSLALLVHLDLGVVELAVSLPRSVFLIVGLAILWAVWSTVRDANDQA